jgi:zinc protease
LAAAFFILSPAAYAIDIERVISPGGIEAWLVEDHSLPIIALAMSFDGGASVDPNGKEGLGEMVSSLLDEGAGEIDSQRFQQILGDKSISIGFNAYLDNFTGGLKTLTRNRDEAFDLLRLALTQPRFDREPVERIRGQILSLLARQETNPSSMVSRAFFDHAFAGHPYGRPRRGTLDTVERITANDLRSYTETWFSLETMLLGVVGDITPGELGALLDRTFGDLPARSPAISVAPRAPATNGETIVIDHPVPQSTVVFGHQGIARDHPDYYAAYLLNHILGGGSFTSRLYDQVREERGLAYSVGTYLSPLDHSALWMGSVGTANADVAESIDIIRKEWRRIGEEGVTQDELNDTKTNVTGAFALRLDSTSSIASMLVSMQSQELGIDYIDRRSAYFESVTLDDISRVAAELLAPDSLTVVIVGQPEGITTTR